MNTGRLAFCIDRIPQVQAALAKPYGKHVTRTWYGDADQGLIPCPSPTHLEPIVELSQPIWNGLKAEIRFKGWRVWHGCACADFAQPDKLDDGLLEQVCDWLATLHAGEADLPGPEQGKL